MVIYIIQQQPKCLQTRCFFNTIASSLLTVKKLSVCAASISSTIIFLHPLKFLSYSRLYSPIWPGGGGYHDILLIHYILGVYMFTCYMPGSMCSFFVRVEVIHQPFNQTRLDFNHEITLLLKIRQSQNEFMKTSIFQITTSNIRRISALKVYLRFS